MCAAFGSRRTDHVPPDGVDLWPSPQVSAPKVHHCRGLHLNIQHLSILPICPACHSVAWDLLYTADGIARLAWAGGLLERSDRLYRVAAASRQTGSLLVGRACCVTGRWRRWVRRPLCRGRRRARRSRRSRPSSPGQMGHPDHAKLLCQKICAPVGGDSHLIQALTSACRPCLPPTLLVQRGH
jgi:hypothetical protein